MLRSAAAASRLTVEAATWSECAAIALKLGKSGKTSYAYLLFSFQIYGPV